MDNNAQVVYSATGQVQVNSNKLAEDDSKEEYNQIIVPKGKRSQIVLADNSKIWINSGSKVIYPRTFEGKYREIYVEGEVYLNVTHDTSKPFIVNTSGFEVRVWVHLSTYRPTKIKKELRSYWSMVRST